MTRGWLTLFTLSGLFAAYWAYAAFVGPITAPELSLGEQARSIPAPEIKPLPIAARIARTHLPGDDWAETAKYQWQRGEETFLYFREQRRIDDPKQNKMRVSPFALVWIDPRRDDGAAYTLVCESALIEFESKLQFGESNPGRIIWGQLQGQVHIAGPDGLEIKGENFVLDEDALRLYSVYGVSFSYGPEPGKFEQVHGLADQVDIRLKETNESVLGQDMPRIGGLRQIALRGNVAMDMVMDDQGKPAPVLIECQREFVYYVDNRVATFDEDVNVARATHLDGDPKQFDWLKCDRLELTFENADGRDRRGFVNAGEQGVGIVQVAAAQTDDDRRERVGIDLDLEFRSLRAVGQNVKLGSQENDLTARMQDLFYDITTRTVELRHNTGIVEARYGNDELTCPFIRLRHDDDDRIVSAECGRDGRIIRRHPDTQQIEVDASWSRHLLLRPDEQTGLDVLEIAGEGRVIQPQQRTGIIADSLRVWLDGARLQSAGGDFRDALATSGQGDEPPVKKVVASSNVALVSPRLHLETQHLEADFVTGRVLQTSRERNESTGSAGPSGSEESDAEQPIVVAADSVIAQLVVDPETEQTDVLHLDAAKRVSISRAGGGAKPAADGRVNDPFTIDADQMELRNQDGSHVLRLVGSPARIRHPEAEIEGSEIFFDRRGNMAVVDGSGALTLLVESDLEGRKLDQPEALSVRWEDEMRFDGLQATFFGQVRTTLADSNMLCERMAVLLDKRLSFSEDRPQSENLEIERIECHDGVTGEYTDWEQGPTLIGIRKVQVASFVVDRRTGEFRAQGPGRIDDWRRGGRRRHVRIDPTASAEKESSSGDSRFPWEYTRVKFAGRMMGHQTDRYLTLNDRVRVMHGPVEDPLDTIDRDEFSQETERIKNAIWIGSDQLQVRLVPGDVDDGEETVHVLATGSAELEGKVFRGRADSISYDESKEMFTLKGRGSEAILWHQDQPGLPYREVSAKTTQFVPSKSEVTLDETRGIRGFR